MELITFVTSISNPLSLRSKPLIHRIPPKANSRTVAPLDLSSLELRSMRTSIAISLQAKPKSMALRASAGNRFEDKLSVFSATVDVKKALKDGGTFTSLWLFLLLNWLRDRFKWTNFWVHPLRRAPKAVSKQHSVADKSKWVILLGWAKKLYNFCHRISHFIADIQSYEYLRWRHLWEDFR